MQIYGPLTGPKQEKILNWLGRTEFIEFQKLLDVLIEEQFYEAKQSESADAVGYLQRSELTQRSKIALTQAMRIRICLEVLREIISKKIQFKQLHYAENQKPGIAREENPDTGTAV